MWKVKSKNMIYGSFGMGLSFMIVLHMLVYFLLFGEEKKESFSIFDNTSHSIRCEENVRAITTKLCDMLVFDSARDNRSLQTMDGHLATPEQCSDLLTFRDIGQSYYSAYVKHYILRDPYHFTFAVYKHFVLAKLHERN